MTWTLDTWMDVARSPWRGRERATVSVVWTLVTAALLIATWRSLAFWLVCAVDLVLWCGAAWRWYLADRRGPPPARS
ncbi:MAG: hypothetical protein JWN46_50 [Acidimicrobiales bacterium]|nr:hypothetical protein [Acidimicrobiales bacterium]